MRDGYQTIRPKSGVPSTLPRVVLSKTLDKVAWKTTRIVREVEEIRKLKQQAGKDMYVGGGATFKVRVTYRIQS
jgi:dihydrofolate reductase